MNGTLSIVYILIITIAIFAGLCFLQILLSKRDKKGLGLVLPCISFFISFFFITPYVFQIYRTSYGAQGWIRLGSFAPWLIICVFLIFPMLTFLGIYLFFLRKGKKAIASLKDLDKMTVQDLE